MVQVMPNSPAEAERVRLKGATSVNYTQEHPDQMQTGGDVITSINRIGPWP